MNTKTTLWVPTVAAVAAVALLTSGCAHSDSGGGEEYAFSRPDTATLAELTWATQEMVRTLCASEAFRAKYDAVKGGMGGALPALQVGNFWNDVAQLGPYDDNRQFTPKLEICRGKAREALQNSGLFRLVDDAGAFGSNADDLNAGMVADVERGLVDSRNLQNAGNFTAADFRLTGHLSRIPEDDRFYFVLKVELHDLATREFWTSTQIFEKF